MNKDKVAALEALYRQLPKISCKGLCHESCGPIGFTQLEGKRIEKKLHRLPTVKGGDLCCDKGPMSFKVATCSLLVNNRCEAYDLRPLICRLWGVVESMRCPHGCQPSRVLTDAEGFSLIRQATQISPMNPESEAQVDAVATLIQSGGLLG